MHIPFLLFVVAVSAPSGATLIDNGAIAIEARTDLQEAILPGEPVSVQFLVRNNKSIEDVQSRLFIDLSFVPENFHVSIVDTDGKTVLNSNPIAWFPADAKYSKSMVVPSGGTESTYIILNEYCPTDLPCGEYSLRMEFNKIGRIWLDNASDIKNDENIFFNFAKTEHAVLQKVVVQQSILVLPKDSSALNKMFAAMAKQISSDLGHATNGTSADRKKLQLLVDKIAYAQTQVAFPYQVQLYSGQLIQYNEYVLNRCHFIAFMRYLIDHPTVEIINSVLQLLEDPRRESQEYLKKSGAFDFFSWALFKVYENGTMDIQALLKPFVNKNPRPREPVHDLYLD